MSMPLLMDEMDDRAGYAYSAVPDRLYVIDRNGQVAYKSGRGPFGFKPGELEQSLIMLLLDQNEEPVPVKVAPPKPDDPANAGNDRPQNDPS
jgi:hypothetical protein